MGTPLEKGNALERAVQAIERVILHRSPALNERRFKIESKKIIVDAGVRHEIDIYVEVDLGCGYKSVFVFECKNWSEPVGKNEIIVFSEKIKAASAQKGFFVARSLTKDAEAQAAKDPRVEILSVQEYDPSAASVPFAFHFVAVERTDKDLEFRQRQSAVAGGREILDLQKATTAMRGTPIDLNKYLSEWVSELCDKDLKRFQSATLPADTYERAAAEERPFAPGEMQVNGVEIESAKLSVRYLVRVIRPPIISDFEVSTRGRSLSLAPVDVGGGNIRVDFVFQRAST